MLSTENFGVAEDNFRLKRSKAIKLTTMVEIRIGKIANIDLCLI